MFLLTSVTYTHHSCAANYYRQSVSKMLSILVCFASQTFNLQHVVCMLLLF